MDTLHHSGSLHERLFFAMRPENEVRLLKARTLFSQGPVSQKHTLQDVAAFREGRLRVVMLPCADLEMQDTPQIESTWGFLKVSAEEVRPGDTVVTGYKSGKRSAILKH